MSPHERMRSTRSSSASAVTVRHHKLRSLSTSSPSSAGSLASHVTNSDGLQRSSSSLSLTLAVTRRAGSSSGIVSGARLNASDATDHKSSRLIGVAESAQEAPMESEDEPPLEVAYARIRRDKAFTALPVYGASSLDLSGSPEPPAFRRWISTLRRKKSQKPVVAKLRVERWALDDFEYPQPPSRQQRPGHNRKSTSSTSSMAFVTAVKSATVTLASTSIATLSRHNSRQRRAGQQSSVFSGSDPRPSAETQRSVMDEAARQRSRKRREKVEELIRTEEGYVADLKALSNALYTLLGYQADSQGSARNRASTTLSRLISLHDDLLSHLQDALPFAESSREENKPTRGHARWFSVDRAIPRRKTVTSFRPERLSLNINRSSNEDRELQYTCEPSVVAAVAGIFSERMAHFSAYEHFGGYYELVRQDVEQIQQSMTSWSEYDSAIETLAFAINPVHSRDANRRKALTVKDLLIKPIQRLPRYELLFAVLCKLTPVCDDPACHAALEQLLQELGQACSIMNKAKDDRSGLQIREVTWLVGERLTFSSQVPRSVFLQLLGQVALCGTLHIAYRSKDRIKGCYVICVLFETTLLLASASDDQQKYSTLAGIALANATIAECGNLKGLQCHTTPHSWKLVFEHCARMYEIIFTACSAPEKEAWQTHIANRVGAQSRAVAEGAANTFELHSPLVSEMRSIGKAFGKSNSFVRRMSVHRTATVAHTPDLNQVIIKNTQAVKEALDARSTASLPIGRSQTVVTPSHVQTLAPRRADRVRLEALLSDVWTKDQLPYPGMTSRRTDPIRAGANHVMRKFSMASIASNFSTAKRTASYTSVSQVPHKEDVAPSSSESSRTGGAGRHRPKPDRAPLVDFHNHPEAFLPADFELQDPAKQKQSALRSLTMTMERPFTPLLCDHRPAAVRRTQSVRESSAETVKGSEGAAPVYSIVRDRAGEAAAAAEQQGPRKSKNKNRLMRMFA